MPTTYDLSTDIGKLRMFIPDRDVDDAIWSDEELQVFLDTESNLFRATALVLETMASDHALVLKVMRVQNIETSGDRVSSALLARAKLLRKQADDLDDVDNGGFEVIEMVHDDFSWRERILNEALRE